MSCNSIINDLHLRHVDENNEFLIYLFSEVDCQGTMYPDIDGFPMWDQNIESLENLDKIGSFFIPHHVELQLHAKDNSYVSIHGPTIIRDTSAFLKHWHMPDEQPCVEGFDQCGKIVDWNLKKISDSVDNPNATDSSIARLRIHRNMSWDKFLHDVASSPIVDSNKIKISHGGDTIEYDHNFDNHFHSICNDTGTTDNYNCDCYSHLNELVSAHGSNTTQQMYINLLESSCDHINHYVPSGVKIAKGTPKECLHMFHTQIKNGTFATIDQGGDEIVKCGDNFFNNVNETSSRNSERESTKESNNLIFIWSMIIFSILLFTFMVIEYYRYLKFNNRIGTKIKTFN